MLPFTTGIVAKHGLERREALREMLRRDEHTHFVTLNFHAERHPEQAQRVIRWWASDVASRLFRSPRFAGHVTNDLFRFIAFPEATRRGDPHYHLVAWVHPDRHDWFERCAGPIWLSFARGGTFDVQKIGPNRCDAECVINYATKDVSRLYAYNEFIVSDLPPLSVHGRQRRRAAPITRARTPDPRVQPVQQP